MSTVSNSQQYIQKFFGIEPGPDGDAEIAEISEKLQRIQYSHGQDICKIDEEADGMYFLDSGAAIVLDRDGKQINLLTEGQYFGEYGVLSGQRRLSTVRSHGKTVVYKLDGEDMMNILRRHPGVYGELMKNVYSQVASKHQQLVALSRMHRGVLHHPDSQVPLTPLRMLIRYGLVALVFVLSAFLVPTGSSAPVFLLPLALMVVYVLFTHQTLESLIIAGLYAALLIWRRGIIVSYTNTLIATISDVDNAFTILVMALIGSFVSLIEASGAITAFKRLTTQKVKTRKGLRFAMLGILAVTSVDDWLNMFCASGSTNASAEEQRVPCEERGLMLSFLPTVLCSFVPISLWGIFVIGSIHPGTGNAVRLFISSIPFNFFSIVVLIAMILLCAGHLPKSKALRQADRRVAEGGKLWPAGSERYLLTDSPEVWGRIFNLLIPVIVLGVGSITFRSIFDGHLAVDSACSLIAALLVMYFLYCGQRLMSQEQYIEYLIAGVQSMALPILLYLLTMCFTSMLNQQALGSYFDDAVMVLRPAAPQLPAALFLVSTLLTVALGSSWAMYVIAFPVCIRIASTIGLSVPLCVGAVCAAGIAGEKCCIFTSDHRSVGSAIGCDPKAVLSVRIPYAVFFSLIALLLYLAAGFLFR